MFCSASVKKLYKKIQTYYYKRESKKEMPVQIPQNISLQNIFASQSQTATKRLNEEKAGCIYQNYKGYQIDEQKFLKKKCNMRISIGQIKLSPIDLSFLAVMQKSY